MPKFRGVWELILVASLAAIPGQSQQPETAAAGPEISTHDAPATFSTGVNLVLVPVVVRDRQNRPLGNLRKEDFQLLDKGKPQVITRFAVEKPGSPVVVATSATQENTPATEPGEPLPPVPERFVAYLFDDVHLSVADLAQSRQAADRHLTQFLTPTARAAIFTTSGRTTQDFTGDVAKLRETLNHILPWTSSLGATNEECPDISYYQADLIQNKNDTQALQAAISEAYACNPPPDNSAASVQAALAQAEALSRAMATRVVSIGDQETRLSLNVLRDLIRRMSAAPGSRSVVLVSPGFLLTIDHRQDEADLMDRAIRANVTINSLDARGLYTIVPGGDASQSRSNPGTLAAKNQFQFASASANSDVLSELAAATGGSFFQNSNALGEGFQRLAAQPEFVYVLGFSPQNLKLDGTFHSLKVVVKDPPGLMLQARRGYYAPRHAVDPEENAREEIREALFSRDELRDIPVDLNLQFFKSSDVGAKLSVIARVDIKQLHFRKAEGRNLDKLTIVSGLFDNNGNFISGMEKIVDMHLRDQTLESLPAQGIAVRSSFDLTPGNYVIRLVVRDSEGQMVTARNGAVRIP